MDCKKAMQQLNDADGVIGPELAEHIGQCQSCARHVRALKLIDDSIRLAAKKSDEATPFNALRAEIESKLTQNQKDISIMEKTKNTFSRRPKVYVGLAVAVAVFLFLTVVPFSYTITTGYEAIASGLDESNKVSSQELDNALAEAGINNAKIRMDRDDKGLRYSIAGLTDKISAQHAAAVLAGLTGSYTISIVPVKSQVSGSLYAQATDDRTNITLSSTDLSEAEIEQEIRNKLSASGYMSPEVNVEKRANGGLIVSIRVEDQSINGNTETENIVDLQVLGDGGGEMSIEMPGRQAPPELDIEGAENMTDDELKAAVEAKLAAQGIVGAIVKIKSHPDGRREIDVTHDEEVTK